MFNIMNCPKAKYVQCEGMAFILNYVHYFVFIFAKEYFLKHKMLVTEDGNFNILAL